MNKKLIVPKAKLLPKVLKLLELISNYQNTYGDDIYKELLSPPEFKYLNVSKDLSFILKKCLVSQRLDAATTILDALCQELNMFDLFFFKAASIVLENNTLSSGNDFFFFTRHVKFLKVINKREIALEYLMYLLRHKDLDAKSNVELLISEHRSSLMKNFIIDPLLKAYMGMFDYINWAQKCEINEGALEDASAKVSAEKAISCFNDAIEVPGQWDIFILKLVEMLEFYGRFDEAEDALNKYARLNPENINCNIYLCSFLEKHGRSSKKLMATLKVLADQCPSDSMVLLLAEKTMEGDRAQALKYIFLFLDYPSNTACIKAWELLSNSISRALEWHLCSILKEAKSFWEERCDIWPYVHFDVGKLKSNKIHDMNLLFQKALVLSVFEKRKHPYVIAVLEIIMLQSTDLHDELKEKLRSIRKEVKQMRR